MAVMDVALSDLLTCPRCGPTYGLILLPDEVVGRRVVAGVLGCANCRERYPVRGGVADLRVGAADGDRVSDPDPDADPDVDPDVDPDAAVRLAALLDLAEGGGTVLLAGPGASRAAALSRLVSEVRVVVVGVGAGGAGGGEVSVLRSDVGLPLRAGSLRGVSLTGVRSEQVEEGARLLGAGGRLVLDPAPEGARSRVEAAGLRVLLEEGSVLVAGRVG